MIPATGVADRDQAVLVVVDIQERLAAAMQRREQVISRSALLVAASAIVGVPVIVTRQYPRGLGDLEPAVAKALEDATARGADPTAADKVSFDCFCEPAFCDAVAASGRRQLVLCGMETHICITQTALAGVREGFDVHVAGDATCSREMENHQLALARMAHAGVVVTTAESVAYELVGRAGTDEFKSLLAAVKG